MDSFVSFEWQWDHIAALACRSLRSRKTAGSLSAVEERASARLIYMGTIGLYNSLLIPTLHLSGVRAIMTYVCTVCEATLGITGWILWGVLIDTEDYYLDVGLSSPEEWRSPLWLVCSTINKILDLSLNRCKTGWILSLMILATFSTKGV